MMSTKKQESFNSSSSHHSMNGTNSRSKYNNNVITTFIKEIVKHCATKNVTFTIKLRVKTLIAIFVVVFIGMIGTIRTYTDLRNRQSARIMMSTTSTGSLLNDQQVTMYDSQRIRSRNSNNNENSNSNTKKVVVPRAFEQWSKDVPLPCYPAEEYWIDDGIQSTPTKIGFIYIKPYKTGSSTCAGINLRISQNVARRKGQIEQCKSRYDHGWATFRFQQRSRAHSFMWTIIREPTKRAISSFFHFGVSRFGLPPTDPEFIHYLSVSNATIFQDDYLKTMYLPTIYERTKIDPIDATNTILQDYDFIGITERMHESTVALMMILNLSIGDMLYLSAKKNGGYDDGGGNGCTLIHPTFVSPNVSDFLQTDSWNGIIENDLRLYQAANKSLDMTIEKLGHDEFYQNVQKLQHALKVAEERCLPTTVFPCDENGVFHPREETNCIWNDSGCGTECLDMVATELGLW